MKSFLKLLLLVGMVFTACQTDKTATNEGVSSIEISIPHTRTSLGDKQDGVYPIYWSEGDRISVNGVESSEAVIDETDPSRAQFSFGEVVNYPLNILYPAGSNVTFPAEQSYAEGTFAEGSVPMCAYVASKGEAITMTPGLKAQPWEGLIVEAVAAYNTTEGHTDFHPKAREDCGYVLELVTGLRIYIAGDTEPTPEMMALKDIDVAFIPVNQPYTMRVDQAVEAVKAIKPKIFYPYHYGEVEEITDIERLKRELEGVTDVRVFPME
jgi:hypothetical protein